MVDLARAHCWILGVVGWLDLAVDDAPQRVSERACDPLFVGVRPMLQDLTERTWILKPEVRAGIEAVQKSALVFDALVHADQLGAIALLADRHSSLTIVLDHAGKPPFGSVSALAAWRSQMFRLAAHANVACKLSGLFSELRGLSVDDTVDPCIDLLLDLFGPERLLWGSDWPVAADAVGYSDWLMRCRGRVEARFSSHHAAIFGGNARRLYRLGLNRRELVHR